jgi:hypothetical protein
MSAESILFEIQGLFFLDNCKAIRQGIINLNKPKRNCCQLKFFEETNTGQLRSRSNPIIRILSAMGTYVMKYHILLPEKAGLACCQLIIKQ